MQNLLAAMESVGEQVFRDYAARGGIVRDDEVALGVEKVGSFNGGLTPLLWMARQFTLDYQLDFPDVAYFRDPAALTGVRAVCLTVEHSGASAVFSFADFLRNEIVPAHVQDLDLSLLLRSFKEWSLENVFEEEVVTVAAGSLAPEMD